MADAQSESPWQTIDVDGDRFEWCVVPITVNESDGRPANVRSRPPGRKARLLSIRRPGEDKRGFGIVYESDAMIDEATVRDAIRSYRETTPLAHDYRRPEYQHVNALAAYWGRLPSTAHRELACTWLERCERRCGSLPAIDDREDLREISTKTLLAARSLGLADGDDEEAAQEREVRAAFEKHVGPV